MSDTLFPLLASFASWLVSFPGAVTKCLAIISKEGFFPLSVQEIQSPAAGSSWRLGFEAARYLAATVRECGCSAHSLLFI